ncbi:LLM class flavin-dependent oxidoreductase [Telmatospirillum siberiense]|uniref:Luciferase-like monooxygenase n=1 Tax=Telmatospirillum siberiense TaxID=382514 RepID=A0A2N3PUR6_9PROT|nr:LLM class flavin-dependent oxidoreductase [Telmatospirillum siberiense]PKU24137.1 LLM class flavin-dependent oxidoreductase [Telmatospirillum siberiense]
MIPFSLLDLSPITQGGNAALALHNTLDLARHAEDWGYRRYWLAEHHNMTGIASAATAVVIGTVAGATRSIRVGAGGVMLPNHSPLVIAEQFGTLEALYPGRIDLGVGRAPGSDQITARALRRHLAGDVDEFPRDVLELLDYFAPAKPGQAVRAVPGEGLAVPVWILGSSLYGAQLAAALGLPYAFASHFAPEQMMAAVQIYRERFEPSGYLASPHVMLAVNVFAADGDEEAKALFSSQQQAFANLRRGQPGPLPPPVPAIEKVLSPAELAMVDRSLACRAVGSAATVARDLADFIRRTTPDEVIVTGHIFDHQARLRSFAIAAEVLRGLDENALGSGAK